MTHILTLSNGIKINMTPFIMQQMEGTLTRQDVLDRIEFYKNNTK
jgi:hypothetical protein